MSTRAGRTTAVLGRVASRSRQWARRPRGWYRSARAHPSTNAVVRAGRATAERAALATQARPHRSARAADWQRLLADVAARAAAPPVARRVSIILIADGSGTYGTPAGTGADVEVLTARPRRGETAATAARRTAIDATGAVICFVLASTTTLEPGWVARLANAVDGAEVTGAAPLVVHPLRPLSRATPFDGRVRARGLELGVANDAPVIRAGDAGAAAAVGAGEIRVAGATAACFAVDRRAYTEAGSLPESDDLDLAIFELARRLDASGGRVVVVSDSVAVDHRPVASRRALTEPIAPDTGAWRTYVEAHGPALMRAAAPLPATILRIALTVAAPSEKIAPRWGDWHLAQALARALRRRGHVVRVQTLDHADDLAGRACDVHCVVRGLGAVRRTPGQAHVLWVISHPEHVTAAECDEADLVLVASTRFADDLRSRTRTPVEVMLQATDVNRFRPVPVDPRHAHDVAVVAKSRDVFRSSVADALAVGIRPAIYGNGWEAFVDPTLVVADYVPNEELPIVYSSIGVLLTDHWDTMHEWGFVSNRLFDALACDTPVIAPELPEINELFAGAVLTYREPGELRAIVDTALADRPAARERAARGRALVVAQHTFDHRAEQFLDALRRHRLIASGESTS